MRACGGPLRSLRSLRVAGAPCLSGTTPTVRLGRLTIGLRLRGRCRSLALRAAAPVRVITHGPRGNAAHSLRSLA